MKPLLALTVGDVAGIGPEITPAAVRAVLDVADVLVLGPDAVRPDEIEPLSGDGDPRGFSGARWCDTGWPAQADGAAKWKPGEVQASCGAAAVAALRRGHELALAGAVDALVTGPVNKAALHAAGTKVEGQTELLSQWCATERTEMIGFAGKLRVMLATRHMPLRDAIDRITTEHILDRLRLFDSALRSIGFERPSIAVAGLNPHAGEGGLLGSEDGAILAPAVAAAQGEGIDALGPVSPDSVFAEGLAGVHTGVLALYHDQAFIPLKLASEGRGVTFIAGLPYARFSPMHGTAFDIVGHRTAAGLPVADPENLIEALRRAAATHRRMGSRPGERSAE